MLDLADFVTERGGSPNKIKESQRRRFASENVVDEVITLYEEARRGMFIQYQSLSRRSRLANLSMTGSTV